MDTQVYNEKMAMLAELEQSIPTIPNDEMLDAVHSLGVFMLGHQSEAAILARALEVMTKLRNEANKRGK
jgi:hypothetical protein